MNNHTSPWCLSQKILFRFFSCFLLLYILGRPISFVFRAFVPWFAAHVLRLEKPITIFTNGSGDTTYDYVTMLVYLLLALLGTIIWSLLDRKRNNYVQLLYWVNVFVRYFLAYNMIMYGFFKIFHLQMPFPSLSELIQPLGDKSPMGLAWTYVGFSKGFSFFTGIAEVIVGVLLFFRRTVTLGALISVAVSVNILAINLFFDVPVKLFSATLLLMSMFLLAPDFKRLVNFFLLNKSTEARVLPVYIKKRWLRITALVTKCLIIGYLLYNGLVNIGIESQKSYGDLRPKPPLYGLYDAELVVRNGDTIPPLITDSRRWKNLVLEWEGRGVIKTMNDSVEYWTVDVDTVKKSILLNSFNDTSNKDSLRYQKTKEYLILEGKIGRDSIYMHLKERDLKSFRLMNRGFRWVNEYPYNR